MRLRLARTSVLTVIVLAAAALAWGAILFLPEQQRLLFQETRIEETHAGTLEVGFEKLHVLSARDGAALSLVEFSDPVLKVLAVGLKEPCECCGKIARCPVIVRGVVTRGGFGYGHLASYKAEIAVREISASGPCSCGW